MATISGLIPHYSGIIGSLKKVKSSKLALQIHSNKDGRFIRYQKACTGVGFQSLTQKIHVKKSDDLKCNSYSGRYNQNLSFDDEFDKDPYWLNLIKQSSRAMKSLLKFLAEQPSQLKYIEWPSFQSTLKTATLTLVLVGILIVALASVDSSLSYLLALLLRRNT